MNKALESALSNFQQENGELVIANKRISEIIKQHSTPVYVYDLSMIQKRHDELRAAIPAEIDLYYAVKANPNVELLRAIGKLYDGLDIASKGEMKACMNADLSPQKMSFAGPGKSIQELTFAIEQEIGTISIESELESERIISITAEYDKNIDVLIRVNPDFELAKSGLKMGGGAKQFGIDSERIPDVIKNIRQHKRIQFKGIHIYAGSQNLSPESLKESFEKILAYADELSKETKVIMEKINLGGGFGIPYFAQDDPLDIKQVGMDLKLIMERLPDTLKNTKFVIELGRYIVAECGIYISEIIDKKVSRDQIFLVINGGMHQHLPASGNFGMSLVRRPFPVTVINKLNSPEERVNIVGPLCTPLDTFGLGLTLPRAGVGDFVGVMNSGAYGFTASPLKFLSHDYPLEIII